MEKYIIFLAYLAIPMDILYLHNKKQKKSILISILITLIALTISILISTENKPQSIAALIEKMLYPITKKK
jgi:uncharacterized membrane protein